MLDFTRDEKTFEGYDRMTGPRTHKRKRVHTYIRTYIHAYMHTYMHTYIHVNYSTNPNFRQGSGLSKRLVDDARTSP